MRNRIFLIIFVNLVVCFELFSQYSHTLYSMRGVPQRAFVNPALNPDVKFFIGMPGLSMLQLTVGNTGFSFNNVVVRSDSSFSLDVDNMLNRMSKIGILSSSLSYQTLTFGFRLLKRNFFTFSMNPVVSQEFYYPKDLFGLVWKGNGHEDYLGKRVSLDRIGLELCITNEISASYSIELTKRLKLGARYRHINGLANINTQKFIAGVTTNDKTFAMDIDLDANINISVPFVDYDSITSFDLNKYSNNELIDNGLDYLRKNKGYALDIGFSYNLLKRFFITGSVNNIGSITWAGNPLNIKSKGCFTFEGIDIFEFIKDGTLDTAIIGFLIDSIFNSFPVDSLKKSYTQVLNPIANLGVAFSLTKSDVVGVLSQNRFYNGYWYPGLTISYSHYFSRILTLSASYDFQRGGYKNLGVGAAAKIGPLQFYLIFDNALAFAYPFDAKKVSVMTGFNWVFGTKSRKDINDIYRF